MDLAASVVIKDTLFTNNTCLWGGGAIYQWSGTLVTTSMRVEGNITSKFGPGVYFYR